MTVRLQAHLAIDADLALALRQVDPGLVSLTNAVDRYSELARQTWAAVATDQQIRSPGYMARIGPAAVTLMPATSSALLFELVIENDHPRAEIIEDGHSAFHLPSRINWAGPKVKHGKKGPYLHIPFRHTKYTEFADDKGYTFQARRQMMPADITRQAEKLRPRIPTRSGPQYDAQGRYTAADRYTWGGKASQAHRLAGGPPGTYVASAVGKLAQHHRGPQVVAGRIGGKQVTNPAWQSGKYEGLFRAGEGKDTAYMTVRTITPNSQGWNIPARLGKGIVRALGSKLVQQGQDRFDELLEDELRGLR